MYHTFASKLRYDETRPRKKYGPVDFMHGEGGREEECVVSWHPLHCGR